MAAFETSPGYDSRVRLEGAPFAESEERATRRSPEPLKKLKSGLVGRCKRFGRR